MPRSDWSYVSGAVFPVPVLGEQTMIAQALRLCDDAIDLLARKVAALEEQKKGLMQRLLTGQVRVMQHIEPAQARPGAHAEGDRMDENLRPARIVPPGSIIRAELEARGWTQRHLAEIMGRPARAVSEIINARREITPQTARELAAAFGTSVQFWLNLEANYRLHLAQRKQKEKRIERRARLRTVIPFGEVAKKGWITKRGTLEEDEREVCRFLGVASLDEEPPVALAARSAGHRAPHIPGLVAWARRAVALAAAQPVAAYSPEALAAAVPHLLSLAARPEDVRRVPDLLRSVGVHFMRVPHLPKTYLDGAALAHEGHPIVALTLRLDWLDSFWFTLMHEVAHVVDGHPGEYLDALEDKDRHMTPEETRADALARDWLVPAEAYAALAAAPVSARRIEEVARSIGRHPSIVAGRWRHDHAQYRHFSGLRVRVKEHLAEWEDVPFPAGGQ